MSILHYISTNLKIRLNKSHTVYLPSIHIVSTRKLSAEHFSQWDLFLPAHCFFYTWQIWEASRNVVHFLCGEAVFQMTAVTPRNFCTMRSSQEFCLQVNIPDIKKIIFWIQTMLVKLCTLHVNCCRKKAPSDVWQDSKYTTVKTQRTHAKK